MSYLKKQFSTINGAINGILTIIAIACFIIIFVVDLQITLFLFKTDNKDLADGINDILLNLSFSYITGYTVYYLTVMLPHSYKQKKIKEVIDDKLSTIKDKLTNSVLCIYDVEEWEELELSKEAFVEKFKSTMIAPYFERDFLGLKSTIFDYINKERKDINDIISELIEYRDYLSFNSLVFLESIRSSDYFKNLRVLENYSNLPKDLVENKQRLGESLYKLYEKVKDEELSLD